MIPIVSLANLLNAIIAFLVALKVVRVVWRASADTNPAIARHFAWFFVAFGLMWLCYAMPGLIIFNVYNVAVVQFLADILAFVAVAVGLRISFFVLDKTGWGKVAIAGVLMAGVVYTVGHISNFTQSIIEQFGPYVYYIPQVPPALQTIVGVATGFGSLVFVATFMRVARRENADKLVAKRAWYLSTGMLCMFVASTLFFILITPSLLTATITAIFSVAGFFLLQRGVAYGDRG